MLVGGACEFSVDIRAMDGSVEFVGYEYSLIYAADGGKPWGFEDRKLERVEFFSNKWYHCYNKYCRIEAFLSRWSIITEFVNC